MFEIVLINMPFADVLTPSLALTQLKYVVEQAFPATVRARILYLNNDFAGFLGAELCHDVALGLKHHTSGFGDWLFRKAAFPEVEDNIEEYFTRYYPRRDAETRRFKEFVGEKRPQIEQFLEGLISKYRIDEASLVGFTSMFSQNVACFALARAIKRVNPAITVVIGGANCESPMGKEIAEHVDAIDYVFSGPALINFPQFVGFQMTAAGGAGVDLPGGVLTRSRGAQDPPLKLLEGTVGIGTPVAAPVLGEELDINANIPLDYGEFLDHFERDFPNSVHGPSLTFETSRGCWWGEKAHCTFCGLNGATMSYRAMKPALAIEMFQSLFAYSSRCSRLQCVDNILPKSYLTDVIPHLDTPPNMSVFYEVKADLTESDVRTLAKARVTIIQPGIEALATSTLKLMKKGSTAFQNLTLLKNCAEHEVKPAWNLLVGFPGEKPETFQKYVADMPNLHHLPPPAGAFPVRFDRFSPYFTKAAEYGLNLHPYEYYSLTYPFPEKSIDNLAYYFMDHNFEADYFRDMLKWLAPMQKAVEKWKSVWRDGNPELRARLELRREDGGVIVFDSRSGMPLRYRLEANSRKLLMRLNSPGALDHLAADFSAAPGFDLGAEIAGLKRKGLIFEENGRFLSLVLKAGSAGETGDVDQNAAVMTAACGGLHGRALGTGH